MGGDSTLGEIVGTLPGVLAMGSALDPAMPITGAGSDSRSTGPGELFFAYPGTHSDGIDFLEQAFDAGCAAAVVPEGATVPAAYRQRCLTVADVRAWSAVAAALVYGLPSDSLLTVGVTGTNGKTSSCHIIKALLEAAGHRVLLMTTVGHVFEDWSRETPNTTPDAPLLQRTLAFARQRGATAAVLEVSAHGILLDRISGTRFDGLLFTNLSRDHQDFFSGLEPYYQQKRRLFCEPRFHKPGCRVAIGILDDWGQRLAAETVLPCTRFGPEAADVSTATLACTTNGLEGTLVAGGHSLAVNTSLQFAFNRLNLAGAVALTAGLIPEVNRWQSRLRAPLHVPGRLNVVSGHAAPFRVVVDFAHTDSALDNLLAGLGESTHGGLITVFGAGGDKDPLRRRTLPDIVIRRCRVGVITLDNPRSESPQAIIGTMVHHWRMLASLVTDPAELVVEPDRPAAIVIALELARPGDTVVLAGKGHETGQIFHDRVVPHDDYAIAAEWLKRHHPLPGPAGALR